MSPSAQRAQLDFVRLVAEEPSSLYFEQFLRDGFHAWPDSYQRRFPGLDTWPGVSGLKQRLRDLIHAPNDWDVRLASRSLSLVHQATQQLFDVCTNVLTTDLSWPTYQNAVARAATSTGNRIINIALRDEILYQAWSVDDVCEFVAKAYVAHHCDGLFLPAVDHLGIRLPVRQIVEEIRRRGDLNFVLIDAAQAICHVPLEDCFAAANFVVAGSHKWTQAYHPMGIGFSQGHSRTTTRKNGLVESKANEFEHDPLLRFAEQIRSNELDGNSETVNIVSLFACAGAVRDRLDASGESASKVDAFCAFDTLQRRSDFVDSWASVEPTASMRTQITLLQSRERQVRLLPADALRRLWMNLGFLVSAYPNGVVRISTPYE